MEAHKLKTVRDLLASDDERIELINGELVKRPMARSEHALVQSGLSDEVLAVQTQKRRRGLVDHERDQCPLQRTPLPDPRSCRLA